MESVNQVSQYRDVERGSFITLMEKHQFKHSRAASWATDVPWDLTSFPGLTTVSSHIATNSKNGRYVGENADCVIWATCDYSTIDVSIAGKNQEKMAALIETLQERFPKAQSVGNTIPFTVWALSSSGPVTYHRKLDAPVLADLQGNYTAEVKNGLTMLEGLTPPIEGGRIILWRGEPGTGKTFALRALANAWKPWCEMHYISDPETFFGSAPNYMLHVALGEMDSDKYRLLVLEDAAELVSADARVRSGQGLSRLLNMSDGILGQGMKTLILITTNDELDNIQAAVARPGRCLQLLNFECLSMKEANQWMIDHDMEPVATSSMTVAELYASQAHRVATVAKRAAGFKR